MEDKLGKAHKVGSDFEKKYGYEGMSTKNMDDYTIPSTETDFMERRSA